MLGVMQNPSKAIARRTEKKTLELLLVDSLLVAFASLLVLVKFSRISAAYLNTAVFAASTLFLLVFFGSLFLAYVLQVVVNTLGGKGKYIDALAAVAFSITAPAVGFVVSALLLFVPLAGAPLSFLVLALTFALGIATLYRAVKELFRVDMLVSFISVSILILSLIISVYSMVILNFANRFVMLG